ncbi:sensor histidine kinase [Treponema primitia]|uniref:sensor histidine kinase n=1 Tax=Treponema primitia TaxID=88058 RepID=UPI0002554EBD|nr:histidine kinase [Treponema primitia]
MRFRTRLMLTYSLMVTVIIVFIAVIFETYNLKRLEEINRLDLDVLSKNMSHQLDEMVRPMRFITEFLLSDSKTLSAITVLARTKRMEPGAQIFIANAKSEIRTALATYCNTANFHRVTFFSEYGDILTSNANIYTIPDGNAKPTRMDWVDAAMGKAILRSPYPDPWDIRNPRDVFSITRLVMGNNIASYIEVQKPFSDLEAIYRLDTRGTIPAAAINSRGEIFFSQFDSETNRFLRELITKNPTLGGKPLDHIGRNIAASYYSSYTDIYTIVMQSREGAMKAVKDITGITILMALLLWGLSVFVIFILSTRVTVPIRRLISRMDKTNLDDTEELAFEHRDDELVQLYQSYNRLIKRLNQARHKEEQMSLLHLQAEFDALQAQVNPHFLYNVLNVISHQGVKSGNETICEICEGLASMFRYSAGTERRLVTIREELEYVEHYLYLLKTRYLDKLIYEIHIGEDVLDKKIPKIVVQQLVENAATHGFTDSPKVMRISIRGWIEDDFWYIEVRDNGSGFTADKKNRLVQKMAELRNRIQEGNLNMDIGGMGIPTIYARLLILFGTDAVLRFSNIPKGNDSPEGAVVIIGSHV